MTSTAFSNVPIPPDILPQNSKAAKATLASQMATFTADDQLRITCSDPSTSVLSQQIAYACYKALSGTVATVAFDENWTQMFAGIDIDGGARK